MQDFQYNILCKRHRVKEDSKMDDTINLNRYVFNKSDIILRSRFKSNSFSQNQLSKMIFSFSIVLLQV